jgi:putative hydrolase of the HAD superfamily
MGNIIIFDGDDTLWSTMPLYDIAKGRFADCVRALTPSADEAIRRLDEIDHANVAQHSFTKGRFPGSMVQAYRVLCLECGVVPEPEVESQLLEAGQAVFTSAVVPYPDADACLARLAPRFQLVLATKGDAHIQGQRVEQSGFGHYFTDIRILAEKTDQQFRDILHDRGCIAETAWSVGNSVRSDINPSLRVGLSAVLIPRTTWQYEDEPVLSSPRLFVTDSLTGAAEHIIQLSK